MQKIAGKIREFLLLSRWTKSVENSFLFDNIRLSEGCATHQCKFLSLKYHISSRKSFLKIQLKNSIFFYLFRFCFMAPILELRSLCLRCLLFWFWFENWTFSCAAQKKSQASNGKHDLLCLLLRWLLWIAWMHGGKKMQVFTVWEKLTAFLPISCWVSSRAYHA